MTGRKPLTADDLPWIDAVADEDVDAGDSADSVEPDAAIKRRFNAKVKEIEGEPSDRTLSEMQLAADWMEREEADRYLHADGRGWRRYLNGRWHEGAHWIYKSIAAEVRSRVEGKPSARSLNKHSTVRNIMSHAEEHLAVDADTFDANQLHIAFPDATLLDVETWTRRPATREDRITKTLATAPADEPSGRWASFLFEALSHYPEHQRDEIAAFMQEWVGVAMTGSCINETFMFLWGTKGAGKGTFSETLCALLGDYGTTLSGDRLAGEYQQHRQWMAGLQGKRFCLVNELPEKGRWRSEDLNKLVSGENIEANLMRQNSFVFRSQAHLLFVGNTQPSANAASGIWRRLIQIEFRHKPKPKDRMLKARLLADLPGIAAWALEGLRRWVDRGHLPEVPQAIREGVERYANSADPVAAFIAERTVASPGNRIEVNDLYQAYADHFRIENGHDAEIFPKQRTFARRVSDLWGAPEKSNGKLYRGGRMLDQVENRADNVRVLPGVITSTSHADANSGSA